MRMSRSARLAIVAATCAALTGCGAANPTTTVASAGPQGTSPTKAPRSAAAYVACMREHDIAMLDELTAEGRPQVDKNAVSESALTGALEACEHLLPEATTDEQLSGEDLAARQRYAACLRNHGVPEYPDPDPARPDAEISEDLASRLKANPQLPAAEEACRSELPNDGKGTVGG